MSHPSSIFHRALLVYLMGALPTFAPGIHAETLAPLSFEVPAKGFLSLGVYDERDMLIRHLSNAAPVEAGKRSAVWDGTTNLGLAAAPGDYHLRGVWFSEPPKINYRMKVGLSGKPPYLTPDDRGAWGGNLGAPMAVCTNGKALLAVFECVESPKTTGIQLMDWEGNITRRFTSFLGWDTRRSATMDEKNLYIVLSHSTSKRLFVGKYDLDHPPRGKILCDLPAGDHATPSGTWKGRWTADSEGLALHQGRLYVPILLDDKVFVLDADTGKTLHAASVPSPHGIAVHDGRIFLASGREIIELNADGERTGSPVVTGLDAPSGLAIDAAGNFYVADGGASQQVKVFAANGKPLREIGVKGGRPRNGVYDPAGLLDPRSVCVTPAGQVWVASSNEDFQEITVWNKEGKREKAFYNTRISSGEGRLSPDRSEMLVSHSPRSDAPGLTAYKLNWARGEWAPSWHLDMHESIFQQADVLLGHKHAGTPQDILHQRRSAYLAFDQGMVQANNGKTYLYGGDFSVWLFDPATKQPKLASLIYTHRVRTAPDGRHEGDYDQGPNCWFAWADTNADGKMALDEAHITENSPLLADVKRLTDWQLQPDLSILILAAHQVPGAPLYPGRWVVMQLPPREVLPSGVPVYDWSDLKELVTLQVPDFKGGDGGYKDPFRVQLDHLSVVDGAVYVNVAPGTKTKLTLTGIDGDGWWASRNWRMSPMKFDLKTGQPAWLKLGSRAAGKARPGEMYYPGWGLAGSVDGISYFADAMSQVWAWTDDGLFLGNLYNEGGNVFDANSVFVELTGSFAYEIAGKTYVLTGDHGISVHEVPRPKLTRIDAGTLTLTPKMVADAKPWDPDGPPPGKRPTYVARSLYDFDRKQPIQVRTVSIDGKLDPAEWDGVGTMPLTLDGKNVGSVRAAFDKTSLYLAYEVHDRNGLKNDGHELPFAPFVSGAYVDFVLGPDWAAPGRANNLEGDVRGILARIKDSADYQLGFWPVKQDLKKYRPTPKETHSQTITSPVQQRHFDDITPIPGLTFAYQVTAEGYTLEAAVPFESLGIDPAHQPTVGFDASVAFADPAGQVRARAVHWAGESESVVVDRPGSAELKPATWGTLQFDRTPLPPAPPVPAQP